MRCPKSPSSPVLPLERVINQLHFASFDTLTPGDHPQVLDTMNPAALKASLATFGPRRR